MEENMDVAPETGLAENEPCVSEEAPIEVPVAEPAEQREPIDPSELAALRELYPHADPVADMADPLFCGLLSGDVKPTLRQVYELCHHDDLTAAAVSKAVSTAVADAVSAALAEAIPAAVAEAEANLMEDIRLRGARPSENGVGAPGAVESHPSVDRLTRSERAALAYRAERGERIRL